MKIIASLVRRIEELERKVSNQMRVGQVIAVDTSNAKVKINTGGLESAWIPWSENSGQVKTWNPPVVGQQMAMFSPSGETGQGLAVNYGYSDSNPAPSNNGSSQVMTMGGSSITITSSEVTIKSSNIVFEGAEILLKGTVHLGDKGGALLHRKGDADSKGHAAVGSASKVYAV